MGQLSGIVCHFVGHRWDVQGVTGAYQWCSRCRRRRSTPATLNQLARGLMADMKEFDAMVPVAKAHAVVPQTGTRLREEALRLANVLGGPPEAVVKRAQEYLTFLTGRGVATFDETAVLLAAERAFDHHSGASIPVCIAETINTAMREMVRQANGAAA